MSSIAWASRWGRTCGRCSATTRWARRWSSASTVPSRARDLARLHVRAHHRIEVVALVPARVAAMEEGQPLALALRELGVGFEPAPELGGERGVGRHHLARDILGDVIL